MPRWCEVAIASVALVLLAPLLALVSVVVRVTSPGPALYRQSRVGRDGVPFTLLKFRTMADGAERHGRLTLGHRDPRLTPVGSWLRRTKLDELPQLVNVVRGDMSFVGPRPEVAEFILHDNPDQAYVLRFRPGITDPASLQYRDEASILDASPQPAVDYATVILPAKLALSAAYLRQRTAASDVRVVLQTLAAVARPHAPEPAHA